MYTWLVEQVKKRYEHFLRKYFPEKWETQYLTKEDVFRRDVTKMMKEFLHDEDQVERVFTAIRRQASHDHLICGRWHLAAGRVREHYLKLPFVEGERELYLIMDAMERSGICFVEAATGFKFLVVLEEVLETIGGNLDSNPSTARIQAIELIGSTILSPLDEVERAKQLDRPRALAKMLKGLFQVQVQVNRVDSSSSAFPDIIHLPEARKRTPINP